MNVSDAQKLRDILFIAGFLIMMAASIWEPFLIIGTIVAFSGLIPDFLYNKCPRCGKHLGRNQGDFCHHCGGKIDEESNQ